MQQIYAEWSSGNSGGTANAGDMNTFSGAMSPNASSVTGHGGAASGTGYRDAKFDSADSTVQGGARTGDETRPFNAGINYIIRV